jgi:tRNA A37 threonylcarbamoyladenosine dehydratase
MTFGGKMCREKGREKTRRKGADRRFQTDVIFSEEEEEEEDEEEEEEDEEEEEARKKKEEEDDETLTLTP